MIGRNLFRRKFSDDKDEDDEEDKEKKKNQPQVLNETNDISAEIQQPSIKRPAALQPPPVTTTINQGQRNKNENILDLLDMHEEESIKESKITPNNILDLMEGNKTKVNESQKIQNNNNDLFSSNVVVPQQKIIEQSSTMVPFEVIILNKIMLKFKFLIL